MELEEILPIQTIESPYVISKSDDISVIFKVTKQPEVFTLDESVSGEIYTQIYTTIASMPIGATFHKMDVFTKRSYYSQQPDDDFLSIAEENLFDGMETMEVESYIIFSYSVKPRHNSPDKTSFYTKYSNDLKGWEKKVENFNDLIDKIISSFETSAYLSIQKLEDDNLLKFLDRYYNLTFGATKSDSFYENESDYLKIGQRYSSFVSATDEPVTMQQAKNVDTSILSSSAFHAKADRLLTSPLFALGLGFASPHILHSVIQSIDSKKEEVSIRRKKKLQRLLSSEDTRHIADEMEAELQMIRENNATLLHYYIGVQLFEDSPAALRKSVLRMQNTFEKNGFSAYVESYYDRINLFLSLAPANASECYRFRLIPAKQAPLMLAFDDQYISEKQGVQMCDRRGKPVFIDMWNKAFENRNKLVIGGSGGGKSFTINQVLWSYSRNNQNIVIIDVGASYRKLAKLRKGKYLEYNAENLPSINPFAIDVLTEDKKMLFVTIINIMVEGDKRKFRNEEVATLNLLFDAFYENVEGIPSFKKFFEFLLSKNGNELKHIDLDKIMQVLREYYDGGKSKFFSEGKEEMEDSPFLVFELGGVQNHPQLYPIVTLLIINSVLSKMMKNDGRRTTMVLDEAWANMTGVMGGFIEFMFRTCRKHDGEAILITQSANDLEQSPIGRALIENSKTLLLLEHPDEARLDTAQKVLGLTDHERNILASIDNSSKHREVFIKTKFFSKVFQVLVSKEAVGTYTTTASEVREIQKETEKYGGNMEFAIQNFASKI